MRPLLFITTSLMAVVGSAHASQSPVQVTLAGSVEFRAALAHESRADSALNGGTADSRHGGDFATTYELGVLAEGGASHGIRYGAELVFDNSQDHDATKTTMDRAFVWVSGSYGRAHLGDESGASDLFVFAPTVGVGQIDSDFMDFTDSLWERDAVFFDMSENNTKASYFSPKIGNDVHSVQMGWSFAPNEAQGSTVLRREPDGVYKNVIEIAGQYEGSFDPISMIVSPIMTIGEAQGAKITVRDYTAYGVGAQVSFANITIGGSYADGGHKDTATGEDMAQTVWTMGLAYEKDLFSVAASYLNGRGYGTTFDTPAYVDAFGVWGLGVAYAWLPGMVTAGDALFFDQNRQDTGRNNIGHVFTLSQKMTF